MPWRGGTLDQRFVSIMCFHTKQTKNAIELENRFKAKIKDVDQFTPSGHINGFDFPKTPIITNTDTTNIQLCSWGLIPHWATSTWDRTYTLNAKIETLTEKRSYKDIVQNRCLVLVNGFYEWQQVGKNKLKYDIGIGDQLFALAGLYDTFNGQQTYTIVTTEALGIMKDIHNIKLRMPYALQSNAAMQAWLGGDLPDPFYQFSSIPPVSVQGSLF